MKVGSLVKCIDNTDLPNTKPLDKSAIYTIRSIRYGTSRKRGNRQCVLLEEIINGLAACGKEWAYYIGRFVEIQEPMDLSELMNDIKELQLS
jgi:hypothetical protein